MLGEDRKVTPPTHPPRSASLLDAPKYFVTTRVGIFRALLTPLLTQRWRPDLDRPVMQGQSEVPSRGITEQRFERRRSAICLSLLDREICSAKSDSGISAPWNGANGLRDQQCAATRSSCGLKSIATPRRACLPLGATLRRRTSRTKLFQQGQASFHGAVQRT